MKKELLFKLNLQLFAEGDPNEDQNTKTDLDLLKEIQTLKENSVSKEEYEKLQQEKNDIISQVLNGQKTPNEEQDMRSANDIRKTLFSEDKELTNMEYVENALALRKKVIDEGGLDPFLPYGSKISPTYEDERAVERVVESLEECLEIAQGDPNVFNVEFQRRLVEPPIASKPKPKTRRV